MSELIVLIKDPAGVMFDSLRVDAGLMENVEHHFMSKGARVRRLDSIVTVHFMPSVKRANVPAHIETESLRVEMALAVDEFRKQYLPAVSSVPVETITSWCEAIGAYANLRRIECSAEGLATVWLYSIGGWVSSPQVDPTDRKAVVGLKQYVLSKAGYLHGQKDIVYPIDEQWLDTSGLTFVGYVVNTDDLRQWPADMFRDGYVWMSPNAAYLSIGQRVTAYDRKSVADRDIMLADWAAAGVARAPEPVVAEAKAAIHDWGSPDALALLPQDSPLYASLDSVRSHLLPPVAQVAIQATESANVLCVYVNGMPFIMNIHGVVLPEVLEYCERSFALRTLSLDVLPTGVFHTVFAQDTDFVDVNVADYGVNMVLTPYIITLHDANGRRRDFPREDSNNRIGFITEFYSTLARMYPTATVDLAHYLLAAMQPALKYSVVQQGTHGETLVVSSDDVPRQFGDVSFPVNAFVDLASWAARLGQPNASVEEAESEVVKGSVAEGLNESVASLRESFDVTEPAKRGETRGFLVADEAPEQPATALPFTLNCPKINLSGAVMDSSRQALDAIPGKLKAVNAALNVKSVDVSDRAGADRAVEVPVNDPAGQHVYTAEFMFTSGEQRDSALDRGFLSLVATQLGITQFSGSLITTPRIGQLPSIACAVMETLGLAPEVTYRRLR